MHPRHGMMLAKRNYETAFPDMTSNTLPSGYVASASSEAVGAAWKAFDGVEGGLTFWGANTDVCWLQIQFPSERYAIGYTIVNRGDANAQVPTEWQLLGSQNGSDWTTLDSRTAQTPWALDQAKSYTITTPGAYLYYRLNITDNSLNGTIAVVSELNFDFITG